MKSDELELTDSRGLNSPGKYSSRSTEIRLGRSCETKINSQNYQQSHSKQYNLQEQESKNNKLKDYESFLCDRQVEIEKPELIREGLLTSYKLYKIKTRKNNIEFYDTIVNRRFNDFQFLHHEIIDNYGGYVIPKLPRKNFLANLNLQTHQFAEIRTKQLQKYLQQLINHPKVRFSNELRNFLFDQEFDFSFNKGEFSEQSSALEGFKTITTTVYDLSKTVYTRIMGKKDQRYEFSKNSEEQEQLKLFEREVEDLMKVTKEISNIINQSYEQLTIIHELSIASNTSHLHDLTTEQNYIVKYQGLIQEFQEIAKFIQNCRDAINRTKNLRAEIEDLQDQQAAIESKERENPRNRQLDVIRSKIQKGNIKCEKWIHSLKKELSVYTSEGKTLMQHFVRKFAQLKGQIYSIADNERQF